MSFFVKYRLILALALIVFPIFLFGQPDDYIIQHEHYSMEDGLSHRFVYDFCKDYRGYLWIGTKMGLNRFDGRKFKVFTKKSHGLQGDYVWRLLVDNHKRLWVIYQKHNKGRKIDIIDLDTEQVFPFDSLFKESSIPNQSIYNVEYFPSGEILISTTEGDTYKLVSPLKFQKVIAVGKSEDPLVIPIKNHSFLAFITGANYSHLYHHTLKSNHKKLLLEGVLKKKNFDSAKRRFAVLILNEEGEWFYDFKTEQLIPPEENYFLRNSLSKIRSQKFNIDTDLNEIDISFDSHNQLLWLEYRSMLWAINQSGEIIIDLSEQLKPFFRLGINELYFDEVNNILWIGTNSGLLKLTVTKNKFQNYTPNDINSFPIRAIAPLSPDKLLFSSIGSYVLDLSSSTITPFKDQMQFYTTFTKGVDSLYLLNFGLTMKGVSLHNQETFFSVPQTVISEYIAPFTLFHQTDTFWVGTGIGTYFFESKSYEVFPVSNQTSFNEFEKTIIYHHLPSSKGQWLGTSEGLHYWSQKGSTQYLDQHHIGFIHQDKTDTDALWLASRGDGLFKLNVQTGETQNWTMIDGLSDNFIYAIFEDDYGFLWLSSNYGIMQFNKNSHEVTSYLARDGISNEEFNTNSYYQHTDGQIFFGSIDGLTSFHPKDFNLDTTGTNITPLVLNSFTRYDKKAQKLIDETYLASQGNTLLFKPNDSYIQFNYSLLDFQDAQQHIYTYQIKGLSNKWELLEVPELRLYTLPPGQYTVNLRARNKKNSTAIQELSFKLKVIPPFYRQTWFISLLIGLSLVTIWMVFRYRAKQNKLIQQRLEKGIQERTAQINRDKKTIEDQALQLKALDEMKSRFYANISHELRTPLTLIYTPVKNMLEQSYGGFNDKGRKMLEMIKNNSKNLLVLVQEILDLSKIEANKLGVDESPVFVLSYFRKIAATFESKAMFEGINFEVESDVYENTVFLLDQRKVDKILNNLLSNAFKFTAAQNGHVRFALLSSDNKLRFIVTDNGSGIPAEDLPFIFDRYYQAKQKDAPAIGGTGIGLSLSQELARLMGGKIIVNSELGKGSTFEFQCPAKIVHAGNLQTEKFTLSTSLPEQPLSLTKENSSEPSVSNAEILLVEDNQDLQTFLAHLFTDEDYTVQVAGNGQKALEALADKEFDLIISDIMMPVMDGFTFLHHLKTAEKWRHIPIIMLTARAALQDRLTALRIGVDDYLVKPFEPQELLARVANLLHNHQERLAFTKAIAEANSDNSPPQPYSLTTEDIAWQKDLENQIIRHLNSSLLSVTFLAEEMQMSERQLYRQVKKLIGMTPNNFIRAVRLQKAKDLLENQTYSSVNKVGKEVGFLKISYFSKLYKQAYGRYPSEYFE